MEFKIQKYLEATAVKRFQHRRATARKEFFTDFDTTASRVELVGHAERRIERGIIEGNNQWGIGGHALTPCS